MNADPCHSCGQPATHEHITAHGPFGVTVAPVCDWCDIEARAERAWSRRQ